MIYVLIAGPTADETVHLAVLEGPSCKLEEKLKTWLESLCGPEPKSRLPVIWDLSVAERKSHFEAKKKWEAGIKDFSQKDFIKWLVTSEGFKTHEFATCDIHPLTLEQ